MNYSKEKKDRRVIYTKMILQKSLLELMKEKPVTKITPTELCRHANINRNTFYSHFDKPEDILKSIEDELYAQVEHSIVYSLKSGNISSLLTEIYQMVLDNRELCSILLSEYGDKDFLERLIALAHDRCIAEWRGGGIKDDWQLEMLYRFYVNGCICLIQLWVQEGMKESPSSLAFFIDKAIYSGINGFLK